MAFVNNKWLSGLRQMLKQRRLLDKETVTLAGEDTHGNVYYEAYRPNHGRKFQRYFEKTNITQSMDVADIAHVPPAWDSWLKFKRQDPPTEEELRESDTYFAMQQEMAAKKKAEEKDKDQGEGLVLNKLPKARVFPDLHVRQKNRQS